MTERVKIVIELDDEDFNRLVTNSMRWARNGWYTQPDRFITLDKSPINWDHQYVHWYSDTPSMLMARAYLDGLQYSYQVLSDEVGGDYAITADFPGPWKD